MEFVGILTKHQGLPWTVSIKLAYPFLLGVGVIMAVFLGFHLKYIASAKTTLEHKIVLDTLCTSLWKQSSFNNIASVVPGEPTLRNPFEKGRQNNFYQIIGPTPWLIFLPVRVDIPPPYVPFRSAKPSEDDCTKRCHGGLNSCFMIHHWCRMRTQVLQA
jgi:hypothetical protein